VNLRIRERVTQKLTLKIDGNSCSNHNLDGGFTANSNGSMEIKSGMMKTKMVSKIMEKKV